MTLTEPLPASQVDERNPIPSLARRSLTFVGRTLITASVVLLLFIPYVLWGTGIHEARAQRALRHELAPAIATAEQRDAAPPPVPTPPAAVPGDAVALLEIPSIGLSKAIVEGVGVADLRRAPGHYPGTPLPGQPGNAGIAGHRTTYGAPFGRLDDLRPGDTIEVTTRQGRFRYRVDGSQVVRPNAVWVLDPTIGATLTLTTCHPRFSASQRLIVKASLVGEPSARAETAPTSDTPGVDTPAAVTQHAPGRETAATGSTTAVALWGGLLTALALGARPTRSRFGRLTYLASAPAFVFTLLILYDRLAQLLSPSF